TSGVAGCKPAAESLLLKLADLDGSWRAKSTTPVKFGGDCSQYTPRQGVTSSAVREFIQQGSQNDLADAVVVYSTATQARSAYKLTTSSANLSCYVNSVQRGLQASLGKRGAITRFEYHRTSSPPLGDSHSAGFIRWEYYVNSSQTTYFGKLYWLDA